MSPNDHLPHVLVLPEDDADRELANGFLLGIDERSLRQIQVLRPARGWAKVLSLFESEHVKEMDHRPNRYMVLLLDFDGDEKRLSKAKAVIPDHLSDRVFVLGVWSEPEDLKPDLGTPETVGSKLADDCREETDAIWQHTLLRHNAGELDRLRQHVRPILFPSL